MERLDKHEGGRERIVRGQERLDWLLFRIRKGLHIQIGNGGPWTNGPRALKGRGGRRVGRRAAGYIGMTSVEEYAGGRS